ncbi:AaceriAGL182Cp [[Ashbya] aceris (nom. inval.)]|nr:AaceriAGL182Cp [[Ashbya] aceris (nom. inval.)]
MTYTFTHCKDKSGSTTGTILSFDNCTLLIDPGWSGGCSYDECMEYWKEWIPQVDIILLSQPIQECIGAYAALFFEYTSHFHSRIQVYSTLPVANLGRVATVDLYASQGIIGPFDTNRLDIEDIDTAFDHLNTVKYSQLVDLKSRFDGLSLVAYSSGFAPGGTIWCANTYSEKVLYAPRWNHTRDTILNSADLLDKGGKPSSALMRPSAVITSPAHVGPSLPYRKRSQKFKEVIKKALSANTSVILPSAIGGKFLELFVLVHDILHENKKSGLQADAPVLLLSYSRGRTLTYARSMLEWLSSQLVKTWESRDNKSPFDLGNRLKIVNVNDLANYPGTKICFISQVESLINDALSKVCTKEKAMLILTEKPTYYSQTITILAKAYAKWERALNSNNLNAVEGNPIAYSESLSVQFCKTKPLTGSDLEEFKTRIETRRKERAELLASFQSNDNPTGASAFTAIEDDDDEEEDVLRPHGNSALSTKVEIPTDLVIQPNSLPKHKMFPFQPGKVAHDDYGELVDFERFLPQSAPSSSKRSASNEEDEESYDPHDFEDNRRNGSGSKRRRREQDALQRQMNQDNLSYLDTLTKPQHRSSNTQKIVIRCTMAFVDLAGLVDERSLSIIWPALKPRKMVLLPPESPPVPPVAQQLQKKGLDVIEPELNKSLVINTSLRSLDIFIDAEMDQVLNWQRISDVYTVAHVVGRLTKEKDTKVNHRDKWVLKPLPNASARMQTTDSLRIGDVRLAELKRKLTAAAHVAEFKGEGTLVVDGQVIVRKISESETVVDGTPSELFYKVKSAVADMLAKV